MLSERFLAVCLIGLGIVSMCGGLAMAAMRSASAPSTWQQPDAHVQ
jgi:hypothetical protein